MTPKRIPVVLLAAGASTRARTPKQLLPFRNRPLLRHAAETALASRCRPVHVVLGFRSRRMAEVLAGLPVALAGNEAWESGLGSSIRAGVGAVVAADPAAEAVLLMTADQPLVTAAVLDRIVERYHATRSPIVACSYENTLGVPALFDRRLFEELRRIEGDGGAKKVILRHIDAAERVECPEAALDVDTEEDLEGLHDRVG